MTDERRSRDAWRPISRALLGVGLTCALAAAAAPPDWVSTLGRSARYPEAEYLTGFGLSEESLAEAEEAARSNLAQRIEVMVEGEQGMTVRETGLALAEREFYAQSRSRHRVVLQGLDFERYEEKGRYFALAVLERRRVIEIYRADLARQQEEIQQLLAQSGPWPDSLRRAVQAVTLFGEAWPRAQILQVLSRRGEELDSLYRLRSQAVERFQQLVEGVRLTGRDPAEKGAWGEGLAELLSVEVAGQGRPLVGVPVEFAFVRGSGELESPTGESGSSAVVQTDAEGRARCRVRRVGSVSPDNQVQARLALSSLVAAADSAAVDLLASRTPLPAKIFHFQSELFAHPPPRLLPIFLNGSAAAQTFADGELVDCAIRLPGPASVWFLSIDAQGHMGMAGFLEIQGEEGGPDWKVEREGSELILRFRARLAAQSGSGLETLIALALPLEKRLEFPPGGYYNNRKLWEVIVRQAGGGPWSAGWIGYEIAPKK